MSIERRVRLVETLFERLDQEIAVFQTETQLHCQTGCGKCCTKPTIEASPLEFFPWAFQLFLNDEAEKMLTLLHAKTTSICQIYMPFSLVENTKGSCGNYAFRGLICRLFGYAASKDKLGKLQLATCKIIKEKQSENYSSAEIAIAKGLPIPVFTDYYMQLSQIDYQLGTMMLPINKALIYAIEEVLQFYAYRPFVDGVKKIA